MNAHVQADFYEGSVVSDLVDITNVVGSLQKAQLDIVTWPIEAIVEIFDELGAVLMDGRHPIHRKHPASGLAYIAGWCRKTNLMTILENTFFDGHVLDRYVGGMGNKNREYRAFPKGMAAHWMAGNIPTLGFLSLVQGVLTKNANLVKVASSADRLLAELLEIMATIGKGEKFSGEQLAKSVAIIRHDRSEKNVGAFISKHADVRIFWGSDESVASLKSLPTGLHTADIVFSNKTSFMVIDEHSLRSMDMSGVARRIANDMSVFEQKACASPHTIFLETENSLDVEKFALCLKDVLERIAASFPHMALHNTEVSAILNLRTRYDMFHRAWYSSGLEYTILSDDEFCLGPPVGNRTLYVRKIHNLECLVDLITPRVQTVGILAEPEKFQRITALYGQKGVHRFTHLGAMTHFESPWDGYMIGHHLVRWTSRPKKD